MDCFFWTSTLQRKIYLVKNNSIFQDMLRWLLTHFELFFQETWLTCLWMNRRTTRLSWSMAIHPTPSPDSESLLSKKFFGKPYFDRIGKISLIASVIMVNHACISIAIINSMQNERIRVFIHFRSEHLDNLQTFRQFFKTFRLKYNVSFNNYTRFIEYFYSCTLCTTFDL